MMQRELTQNIAVGSKSRLLLVLILGGLGAFGPFTIDMYLPALPTIAKELDATTSLVQISLTACLIGLAFGQLLMGPFSDIKGRKKPLVISIIIYTIASALCVVAPTIWIFIALRFIQGAAGAAGMVISRASVRDLFSGTDLTKFFAMLMLVNGLAPIVAPIAGGQVLEFVSWRGVFGVLTVIGLVMLISVMVGLDETLPPERRKTGGFKEILQTFGSLVKDKTFVGYALTQGFVMSAMFAYISGSTFVLQEIYGLSPQMFSAVFAINGLGLIIATQVTGRLAGRISESILLTYGLIQAAVGSISLVLAILFTDSVLLLCVFLFFSVTSVGIVNTTVFSLAMQTQGKQAGSAAALLGLLPFLLGGSVAPLVGAFGNNTDLAMGIVIAICELLALCAYMLLVNKKG
ncbi:multidrug effflux MFS transporter [Priestia flexa]|nr:multidrug effflux MFS transporter [Priestia flexa]MBN8435381.1 multidrug effflux MFS transporter [Priestia flexa]MCA0968042.1 multidrug effflux MFS transporter [Priestia flexa]RIV11418.1 Bcr/CflA family efflux MFS transporter [Priestia flexa]UIR32214.1 multidrug effflux MFS transporter [Priestia flexa]